MKAGVVSVAVVVGLLAAPSWAASMYQTGAQLNARLMAHTRVNDGRGSGPDSVDSMFATGYIIGVVDGQEGIGVCTPTDVTVGQVVAMVKKYLSEHPELWSYSASDLVYLALGSQFPCPKTTGK